MKKNIITTCIGLIVLTGCASHLKVYQGKYDNNQKLKISPIEGIPFRLTQSFVKEGIRITHSKFGSNCEHTPFLEIVPVAFGDLYYVNVDVGKYSDASLSYKVNSNGTIQEISMTSKPDSSAIDSTVSALSNLLPFVGALPKVENVVEDETTHQGIMAGAISEPSCNTGEADVVFTPFEDYKNKKFNDQDPKSSKATSSSKSQ